MIKAPYQAAKAEHFFDWAYAQHVWFDLNSREAAQAESDRYAADFKPWLELFKKDRRKALAELKTYPEAKRHNIQRGHDIQLAYDHRFDEVYSPWFNGHKSGTLDRKWSFDQVHAAYARRGSCVPARLLTECGPIPDWRSDTWRAKEQAMMREVAEREQQRKK